FFQAEDGIRDFHVTGVQTCALPILRVMVLVKASAASEAGEMPGEELLTEMGRFNEELSKAGVMLAGEGLHPSARGVRVRCDGKRSEERRVGRECRSLWTRAR